MKIIDWHLPGKTGTENTNSKLEAQCLEMVLRRPPWFMGVACEKKVKSEWRHSLEKESTFRESLCVS